MAVLSVTASIAREVGKGDGGAAEWRGSQGGREGQRDIFIRSRADTGLAEFGHGESSQLVVTIQIQLSGPAGGGFWMISM